MTSSERFTTIGCGLWSWQPWISLPTSDAKVLWLALYTTPEAKRSIPGLWPGTLHGMSEASHLSLNETYNALDVLTTRKLVAFDAQNRLARLTDLPDALDRAHNSQALSGWWTRFKSLPRCPLRDSHVQLIWWLVDQGRPNLPLLRNDDARARATQSWNKMMAIWECTFGTIAIPSSSSVPSLRSLTSSDTSTEVQPSLFGPTSDGSSSEKSRSNKNNHSDPRLMDQPSMADPQDQDQDQDLFFSSSGQGDRSGSLHPERAEGEISTRPEPIPVSWPAGSTPRLQLVPAEPTVDPARLNTERENARAREQSAALREELTERGLTWLLPH